MRKMEKNLICLGDDDDDDDDMRTFRNHLTLIVISKFYEFGFYTRGKRKRAASIFVCQ